LTYLNAAKKAELLEKYHPATPRTAFAALLDEISRAMVHDITLLGSSVEAALQTPIRRLTVRADYTDFSSDGNVGEYWCPYDVPVGAYVLCAVCRKSVKETWRADRYMTGVLDAAQDKSSGVSLGPVSGDPYHEAKMRPIIQVTTAVDFNNLTAGSIAIDLYYLHNNR